MNTVCTNNEILLKKNALKHDSLKEQVGFYFPRFEKKLKKNHLQFRGRFRRIIFIKFVVLLQIKEMNASNLIMPHLKHLVCKVVDSIQIAISDRKESIPKVDSCNLTIVKV